MDTLLRHWHMLRRIPRHPRKVSTAVLEEHLDHAGYPTSRRTIQRDLDKLSAEFPLVSDGNKPSGWSWTAEAELFDVPGMDTSAALTFHMVEEYLSRLLPKGCLSAISPHFQRADSVLGQLEGTALKNWPNKVRIVQRTQVLNPPTINPEVMTTVYEALFHDRRFLGTYRSRNEKKGREFVVNPLGLIFSDPVVYLAATLWDYEDVRLYALHRFSSARMLEDGISRPGGFRLDKYLDQGAVEFCATDAAGPLNLVFRMKEDVAHHLFESPLSKNQKIMPDQEGWVQITATVKSTQQLRWWLLGFGGKVEVLEPESLRSEFVDIVEALRQTYLL